MGRQRFDNLDVVNSIDISNFIYAKSELFFDRLCNPILKRLLCNDYDRWLIF